MPSLSAIRPLAALALLTLVTTTLVSCGREAPFYEPGQIAVASSPAGAAIFLDGNDTGLATPDTLSNLAANRYEVAVALDGYVVFPLSQGVEVHPLTVATPDTFVLSRTGLSIDSDPPGAEIFLAGAATGRVTPAVLGGLLPGPVRVHVQRAGFYHPPAVEVTVVQDVVTGIPADTFRLRSRRTVMLEGFSNVDCAGCPDLAVNMHDLQDREGFGLDRVFYLKYSLSFPGPQDPHTTAYQDQRAGYYLVPSIPALFLDGVRANGSSANSTPFATELEPLVTANWSDDPGFLLDVTADLSLTDVPATVIITAMQDVSLAGLTLHVVLVQSDVHYDTPPGSEGETDFHWIFRDRDAAAGPLQDLSAGQIQTLQATLQRDDWDLDTLFVLAFVQNDADKSILQAGSTALDSARSAVNYVDKLNRPAPAGFYGGKQP